VAVLGAWLAGRLLRMKHEALLVEPGISLALAQDRASRVSSLSYVVTLRVPAALTDAVTGHVTATFDLSDASRPLAFDFSQPAAHLLEARAGGRAVTPAFSNGHVTVPATQLVAGANTVEFAFVAGSEALNRSDDLLYSLFVPARASQTFPCFDQPDVKARWQLSLEVPPGWTAVSNGREEGRVTTADHTGYSFARTELLPTYLFAFAAGRFSVEAGERDGRIFRLFHRETDRRKLERNLDAIFHLHAEALAWLSTYTGIPYPFGKFDLVLIPSFQFGGMEHPGAVYYNASALLLDEAATQNQHLARADVIAHETAHMWFGNLVTMRWFDDVWMKEVFAGFYAARIVNPSFPGINHDLRFLLQHYPAAYDVDRTDGANPIRQELDNLQDAGALYGAIIYQKAPIVMRQLEQVVGADVFQAAVRQYLSSAMYGNAGWPEFVGTLDARTPVDVSAWSRAWVTEGGRPTITTDLRIGEGRIVRLAFTQSDPRGRPLIWPERLRVLLGWDDRTEVVDATIDAAEVVITSAAGQPTPRWVLRSADARRGHRRALGCDGRGRRRPARRSPGPGGRGGRGARRAQPAADARLCQHRILAVHGRERACGGGRPARTRAQGRPLARAIDERTGGLVPHPANRGRAARNPRVADTPLGTKAHGPGSAAVGVRRGRPGAGSRAARSAACRGVARRAARTHGEPRPPRAVCLHHAVGVGRGGRAGPLLREPAYARGPGPRVVGRRRPALFQSPAARRLFAAAPSRRAGTAPGRPADRRHLLSEALG
jgi:hypothetical protein